MPTLRLSEAREQREAARRSQAVWPAVLATAALFVIGALGLQQAGLVTFHGSAQQTVAQGWGWERPGAIPSEGRADAYLLTLARAADEWFNKRPSGRADVELRIREFSRGCQILIEAPHEPLPREDAQWLVDRCKAWQNKLDAHLAALEAGEDPLEVRAEADETISNLIKAMRQRADEVA
jgi:hypothetical protein